MCSTFCVCSQRCSVIMMSMTFCNLLFASFGALSSNVRFHPLGVLSSGFALPTHDEARNKPTVLVVMGLAAIRGLHTSAFRDSMVIVFPCCILEHKQASTLIPHGRLASCRVRYSSFRVPVTPVPSCPGMPCRHHGAARCRVDCKRDLSAPLL